MSEREQPRPRALVAEDDEEMRALVADVVRAAGFEVEEVSDGRQMWIRTIQRLTYGLVVSDLRLPIVDGLTVLEDIRARADDAADSDDGIRRRPRSRAGAEARRRVSRQAISNGRPPRCGSPSLRRTLLPRYTMRLSRIVVPAVPAALALFALACGHETKPAQSATGGPSGVTVTNAPARATESRNAIALSDDLRHVCGIEDTGAAPKFDFDSALLSAPDRSELDQLAKCMTTGPLKGKNVELVGRADPRGEEEYNMNLGAIRANAVEYYLAQLGIARSRFTTTSRGALDAQGHDEATWAVDRRVDLRMAGQ
jgi:peptidoglycan-associated lipoprotein